MSLGVFNYKEHINDTSLTASTCVEKACINNTLWRGSHCCPNWQDQYWFQLTDPCAWCVSHWYSYTVIAALAKPRLACRLPIKAGVKFYKPRKVLLSSFTCKSRDLWVVTPTDRCLGANVMGNCIRLVVERVIRCFTSHSNPPVMSLIVSKLSI